MVQSSNCSPFFILCLIVQVKATAVGSAVSSPRGLTGVADHKMVSEYFDSDEMPSPSPSKRNTSEQGADTNIFFELSQRRL